MVNVRANEQTGRYYLPCRDVMQLLRMHVMHVMNSVDLRRFLQRWLAQRGDELNG